MTTALTNSDWALDLAYVDKVYDRGLFGRLGFARRSARGTHVGGGGGGGVHALRGITMRVHRGEIFGLLGPNGAGKSTLVKILMTIIRATRCEGQMLGAPVGVKPVLSRVGYLPEHHRFPDYLTGSQVLDFFGALSNVPRDVRRKRGGELLELVGMSAWADKGVKGYSKGMRQRLGIANALIANPELVVLDEPTDGVDPVGRKDIREILVRLRGEGKTVFLNSHMLSELEMVCDRVAILVQGRVSAQGTMDELTRESRRYEIETVAGPHADAAIRASLERAGVGGWASPSPSTAAQEGAWSGQMRTGETARLHAGNLVLLTDDAERVQPIIDALRAASIVVKAVRPVRASLEDLFMQAVTDPNTGRAFAPGAAVDNQVSPTGSAIARSAIHP